MLVSQLATVINNMNIYECDVKMTNRLLFTIKTNIQKLLLHEGLLDYEQAGACGKADTTCHLAFAC